MAEQPKSSLLTLEDVDPVAEPTGKPSTLTLEDVNVIDRQPTDQSKIGTAAKAALGGAVEMAPIIPGMVMGAKIGALGGSFGGPLAPFTIPAGAAIGAAAGYAAGKGAAGLLTSAGVAIDDPQKVEPELRPWATGGQTFGQSLPFLAGPLVAAQTGARLVADGFLGRWVNKIIDHAARRPLGFATAETGMAASAGVAGGLAEAYDPGDPLTRLGAEVAGGMFNPIRSTMFLGNLAFDGTKRVAQALSPAARQTAAGRRLTQLAMEAGEDPEMLVRLANGPDPLGLDRTWAQRTGSPVLRSLEARLAQEDVKFGKQATEKAIASMRAMEGMIMEMRNTGDPAAIAEAARLQGQMYDSVMASQIMLAENDAVAAAGRISRDTPAARAALSVRARDAVGTALTEARRVEDELWSVVPREQVARADGILAQYDALKGDMLPEEQLPAVVEGFVRRMRPEQTTLEGADELLGEAVQPTFGELQRFRSRMLTFARDAAAQQKFDEARMYGVLAEGALDDMAATGVQGAQEAREFSRALHDAFTRTFAGQATATARGGTARVPPEVLLRKAFASGQEVGELRLAELRDATRFLQRAGYESPEAEQAFATMVESQQRLVRLAAAEAINPENGRVNPARLARFIRDNEPVLRELDAFDDLQRAVTTERGAQELIARTQGASRLDQRVEPFAKMMRYENPVDAINSSINGRSPIRDIFGYAQMAQRGGQPAIEGLRAAVFDYAIQRARSASGEFSVPKFNEALFSPLRAGQPSLADVMLRNGIFDESHVAHAKGLMDEWEKVASTMGARTELDAVVPSESALFDLVLRVGGAKLGSAASSVGGDAGGGHTLIASAAGSKFMRQALARTPLTKTRDVIAEMLLNPEFGAKVMKEPASAQERFMLARQIHAYLLSAGISAVGDED